MWVEFSNVKIGISALGNFSWELLLLNYDLRMTASHPFVLQTSAFKFSKSHINVIIMA